jgi:hypothetical protein
MDSVKFRFTNQNRIENNSLTHEKDQIESVESNDLIKNDLVNEMKAPKSDQEILAEFNVKKKLIDCIADWCDETTMVTN